MRKVSPSRKAVLSRQDLSYKYMGRKSRWLVLELNEGCSLADHHSNIINEISDVFGEEKDFFLPVFTKKVKDKLVSVVLFEGYVFIQSSEDDSKIMGVKSEYIKGPLRNGRTFSFVRNRDINKFKDELQKMITNLIPKKGQRVMAKVGTFKNLEGKVKSVNKREMTARVVFEQATRVVQAKMDIINLTIVG